MEKKYVLNTKTKKYHIINGWIHSKNYLKHCLVKIEEFVAKEKLQLNSKTRIYNCFDNFLFLGRNCQGNYKNYRNVKRNIKHKIKLY